MRHLLTVVVLLLATAAPAADQPNFVVILCDDLGYGDLACYGNETIRTPNLDRMAREGLRLTACYAAAPVCSPSRAGLLTGRVPSRTGVYDWIPDGNPMHLPAAEVTVATCLRDAGYETAHFGKWHLNGNLRDPELPQPGDHGFEYWFSTQNNARPSHRDPKNFVRDGEPVGPLEGFACHLVVDDVIRWLRDDRDPAAPFFTFVCFHEPHEPIDSPEEIVASYPEATKRGEALYYANVTNMDAAVGRLLAALDEIGAGSETLVLFTSDNGPETLDRYQGAWRSHGSPGPLRGMKLHLYEGGIRVPGIVRWPGRIEPGSESGAPVSSLDVLPTLCALAGVAPPRERDLDGMDVRPILLENARIVRGRPLFWHYYRAIGEPRIAVREGLWMGLGHLETDERTPGGAFRPADMAVIRAARLTGVELYRLADDPGQQRDLAPLEPQRVARLRAALSERLRVVQTEGPDWREMPEDR